MKSRRRFSTYHSLFDGAPQYGEDAIKEGMGSGGGGGMSDLFEQMFGMGGGRGRQRERKSEDVVHKLQVSLEDLYKGGTK